MILLTGADCDHALNGVEEEFNILNPAQIDRWQNGLEEDGMKAEFQKNGTTLSVKPEGRMDAATSPELESLIRAQMEGMTEIIIDLENVEYLSSGGLRILLSLTQDMEEKDGRLKVIHGNRNIMEVFEISHFTDLLTIE